MYHMPTVTTNLVHRTPLIRMAATNLSTKSKDSKSNGHATTSEITGTSSSNGPPLYLDFCSLSRAEMIRLTNGTPDDRRKALVPINLSGSAQTNAKSDINGALSSPSLTILDAKDALTVQPMSTLEHVATVLFLAFGVPNGVLTIPMVSLCLGRWVWGATVTQTLLVLGGLMLPLAILPQAFIPSRLHSWMAVQVVKYFSFRMIFEDYPTTQLESKTSNGNHNGSGNHNDHTNGQSHTAPMRPQILVAPPHGVFPYGNLLAMVAWPCYAGHYFRGLAASAAVTVPIMKQVLAGIGVIDASRSSARRALETYPYTIGISTGGVAEVFETTADDECILLKERVGLIKLAIRTGADIVPCYLFGNTKLMSCWSGHGIPHARTGLEKLSRRMGFALVIPHGRFGLPIPHRIPILAVTGRPIPTAHLNKPEEPTAEQILLLQTQLIDAMQSLFDRYKHLYGWQDKRLIIK